MYFSFSVICILFIAHLVIILATPSPSMALSWRGLARVSAGAGSLPRGWARQRPLWHWVNVVFNRCARRRRQLAADPPCPHRARGAGAWGIPLFILARRVDRSRVRDVGPDKAAAEWALRLGGRVRFHGNEFWSTDYNRLPNRPPSESLLDQIDVGGVAITDNGLEHLGQWHRWATPT